MNKEELLKYELPSYTEFISWGWLQTIIAKRVAKRINYKVERYNMRNHREAWLKQKGLIHNNTFTRK